MPSLYDYRGPQAVGSFQLGNGNVVGQVNPVKLSGVGDRVPHPSLGWWGRIGSWSGGSGGKDRRWGIGGTVWGLGDRG